MISSGVTLVAFFLSFFLRMRYLTLYRCPLLDNIATTTSFVTFGVIADDLYRSRKSHLGQQKQLYESRFCQIHTAGHLLSHVY